MRSLHERGLRSGLWVVPHGQTADSVFAARPAAVVRDDTGRPIPGGYLGKYVVDPTSVAGQDYLRGLSAVCAPPGVASSASRAWIVRFSTTG